MVQSIAHLAEYICVPYLKSILDGSEYSAYSRVHMCSKLKDHFGDCLVITHINFGYLH